MYFYCSKGPEYLGTAGYSVNCDIKGNQTHSVCISNSSINSIQTTGDKAAEVLFNGSQRHEAPNWGHDSLQIKVELASTFFSAPMMQGSVNQSSVIVSPFPLPFSLQVSVVRPKQLTALNDLNYSYSSCVKVFHRSEEEQESVQKVLGQPMDLQWSRLLGRWIWYRLQECSQLTIHVHRHTQTMTTWLCQRALEQHLNGDLATMQSATLGHFVALVLVVWTYR